MLFLHRQDIFVILPTGFGNGFVLSYVYVGFLEQTYVCMQPDPFRGMGLACKTSSSMVTEW